MFGIGGSTKTGGCDQDEYVIYNANQAIARYLIEITIVETVIPSPKKEAKFEKPKLPPAQFFPPGFGM